MFHVFFFFGKIRVVTTGGQAWDCSTLSFLRTEQKLGFHLENFMFKQQSFLFRINEFYLVNVGLEDEKTIQVLIDTSKADSSVTIFLQEQQDKQQVYHSWTAEYVHLHAQGTINTNFTPKKKEERKKKRFFPAVLPQHNTIRSLFWICRTNSIQYIGIDLLHF